MTKLLRFSSWTVVMLFAFTIMVLGQSMQTSVGLSPSRVDEKSVTHYGTGTFPEATFGYGSDALMSNNFVQFPFPAGTPFTTLSVGPDWLSGADFGPGGFIYGCGFNNQTSPYPLFQVDPNTGVFTQVATVTLAQFPTSMGYHEASNTMYLGTTDIATSNLYTIDVNTGATTLIGPISNCPGLIAIAVRCDGAIFGVDIVNDNLVSIDPNTGAGTIVGPLGFAANFAQDADFDNASGNMYLAAYNATVSAGEFRLVDLGTGGSTVVATWTGSEVTGMALDGTCGPPCPVGAPSNPNPPSGSIDIPINPGNATWTNDPAATAVEVWFGPAGNLTQVYNGPVINTIAIPGPLSYFTNYGWRVVNKNDTCGTSGPTWTFRTVQDPNLNCWTDDFEAGTGAWTIVVDAGGAPSCLFQIYNPPYPNTYQLPATSSGGVFALDSDDCNGTTGNARSTATITNPFNFSIYQTVYVEWDNDWNAIDADDFAYVEVSLDGTTWTPVVTFNATDVRGTHEYYDISSIAALQPTVYVRVRSIQPGWDWFWAIDNFSVCGSNPVPVELTSFAAVVNADDVTLNWSTATETNNQGFQVERSNGGAYEIVGYVAGHGTTTEIQNYSYTDQNVKAGTYMYRLKQVDYDGSYEYSEVVSVDVVGPKEFILNQNYPNPFNPATKISFSLAVESKVALKIFDVLGQEVLTLVNNNFTAGSHEVEFDASNLNSGVYFYRIEADGVDGQKFSSVKKMILSK